MTDDYGDIIGLPRHVSAKRPHMSASDRAAQFSPFAALTGYDAAIRETARLTETRPELDDGEKELINDRLLLLTERLPQRPAVGICYFRPDEKKTGGAFVTVTGAVKKIDGYTRRVLMTDGASIPIDDILSIDGEIFDGLI